MVSKVANASKICHELGLDGSGLGQWSRVGLVLAGPMAVEREFVEEMRGRSKG